MCARTISTDTEPNSCATFAMSKVATKPRPPCVPTSTEPTTPEVSAKAATKNTFTYPEWTKSLQLLAPNPQEWPISVTAHAIETHNPQPRRLKLPSRKDKLALENSRLSQKRFQRDEYPNCTSCVMLSMNSFLPLRHFLFPFSNTYFHFYRRTGMNDRIYMVMVIRVRTLLKICFLEDINPSHLANDKRNTLILKLNYLIIFKENTKFLEDDTSTISTGMKIKKIPNF